ncbi:fimbrial protein PefA [Enterobacter roggenkampii]
MKKIFTVSALSIAMMSGSAFAGNNTGDVQFVGVVTDTTCDIVPYVNGAPNSIINVGSVTTSNGASPSGPDTRFYLKVANGATCGDASLTTAVFNFYSTTFNSTGIGNSTGTATDSNMRLTANNTSIGPKPLYQTDNTAEISLATLNSNGLDLSAQLLGGTIPGTYESTMTYTVYYN